MREIKFRVYDEESKSMEYEIAVGKGYGKDSYVLFLGLGETFVIEDKLKIMQYTGLKDKNGVEIYELDILQIELDWGYGHAKILSKVYFENGCFRAKALNSHEDTLLIELPPCEVIGNIYENIELLKDNK